MSERRLDESDNNQLIKKCLDGLIVEEPVDEVWRTWLLISDRTGGRR